MKLATPPLFILLILAVFCLLVPEGYASEAYGVPGGPWLQQKQFISEESLLSNEELGKKLLQIEARSRGKMTLDIAGYSNLGWPLYVAKIGVGETKVLIYTQIHGNEPLGTEAAVKIIQYLAENGNYEVDLIREQLTVWILPRVNPDGAQFFRRNNIQGWDPIKFGLPPNAPAPWYFYRSSTYPAGFDINRDFHPDLNYVVKTADLPGSSRQGLYVTPEARAMRDIFKELRPQVSIDIHHQGSYYVDGTNEQTMLSISAKVCEGVTEEEYILSKQVNVVVYQALSERGESVFNSITRYPTIDYPSSGLGSFALNGAAIMLFEVRWVGQKSNGYLTQLDCIGIVAILRAVATGEVYEVDTNIYDTIPARPQSILRP